MKAKAPILHIHSSFDEGGKELRCVQLINAFGPKVMHAIVSAQSEALGASKLISGSIPVTYPSKFPPLTGLPTPGRLKRIAQAMKGYGLVLTYNWGAMDAVMAHTLFSEAMGLPPLIHHEDGFNEDEARKLKWKRNLYRQIALGKTAALVVPSRRLETIARETWHQPSSRIHRIANGIATQAFAEKPRPDVLPHLIKHEDEFWIGTLAGLRAVKNLPLLVRLFSETPDEWQLVILGEGPQRDAIECEARELGIEHRVHLPGFVSAPEKAIGLFDIFALTSQSEQFPISVVESMAAGLPIAAPAVGDIAHMVSQENAPLITREGDEGALGEALLELVKDVDLRKSLGDANRLKAKEQFGEDRMIARYERLYASAMGRKSLS